MSGRQGLEKGNKVCYFIAKINRAPQRESEGGREREKDGAERERREVNAWYRLKDN